MLKKNQIMITALAIMIAVAGYLNFTGNQVKDETMISELTDLETGGEDVTALIGTDNQEIEASALDISAEDIEMAEIESLDEDTVVIAQDYMDEEMAEMIEESVSANASLTVEEEPGVAVYTSTTSVTSLASARLIKEQTRPQNREMLLEVINSSTADEASRKEATQAMIMMTDIAEKEASAEIMLEAKGFSEVVVSITGDSADVVVGLSELSDSQCAQIIDIVARKTGIAGESIIITPVSTIE